MTAACNTMNNDTDIKIEENKKLFIEDLSETFEWMSKSAEEVGISDEYLGDIGIEIEGKLFGAPADGSITYDLTDRDSRILHDVHLYVYCDDLSFTDCLKHLEEKYGEAYSSGEEPYVEANGGAVEWYRFYTGKGRVHISKGDKHDFYQISYQNAEAPDKD